MNQRLALVRLRLFFLSSLHPHILPHLRLLYLLDHCHSFFLKRHLSELSLPSTFFPLCSSLSLSPFSLFFLLSLVNVSLFPPFRNPALAEPTCGVRRKIRPKSSLLAAQTGIKRGPTSTSPPSPRTAIPSRATSKPHPSNCISIW